MGIHLCGILVHLHIEGLDINVGKSCFIGILGTVEVEHAFIQALGVHIHEGLAVGYDSL